MKKTLFIAVISVLFVSNVVPVSASTACAPGDRFNVLTGTPCVSHYPCESGDVYNFETGEKCQITNEPASILFTSSTSTTTTSTQKTPTIQTPTRSRYIGAFSASA